MDGETRLAEGTALAPLGLAYRSVLHAGRAVEQIQDLQSAFGGRFTINSGFSALTTGGDAVLAVDDGIVDLLAADRPAMATPNLVER